MSKANIMNYKLLVYVFTIMLCIFSLSGINFEKFIKSNRVWETRILVVVLSLVLAYLLTNFIFEFLSVSKLT